MTVGKAYGRCGTGCGEIFTGRWAWRGTWLLNGSQLGPLKREYLGIQTVSTNAFPKKCPLTCRRPELHLLYYGLPAVTYP